MPTGRQRFNLMLAGTVGTTLEWYDFFVFAACAVLVFDKQFYPGTDPFVALMLSLGTFAVGFLARPLGGIVLGILGDRYGRKRMLVFSLILMGAATAAIGFLPTYGQAGIIAPLLLLVLRVVQGIAVGGEATGALLMIAESMPDARRGFWTSFPMLAGPLANVLSAGVIAGVQLAYGEQAFIEWGWRIPFLLSVVLVAVGYFTRRRVQESPAFLELAQERGKVAHAPLREVLTGCRVPMARTFFIKAAENTFLYLFSTFLLLMATKYLGFSRSQALNALMIASMVEVAIMMVAGRVSDSIGRRPVIIVGLIGSAVGGFGLFTLQPGASVQALQVALLVCLAFHGMVAGVMGAFFSELFPTRVRYTGLSAAYQVASVFGGSIAPLIGAALLAHFGSAFSVAAYAAVVGAPALISIWTARETRGTSLTGEVGDGTAAIPLREAGEARA